MSKNDIKYSTTSASGDSDSGIADTLSMPMDSAEDLQEFAATSPVSIEDEPAGPGPTTTTEEGKGWFFGRRTTKHKDCTIRWSPTSPTLLEQAESRILAYVKTPYQGKYINISDKSSSTKSRWCKKTQERKIWTVIFNPESPNTPLVMVHGLCAALGLWAMNIDELAKNRPVYTIDLLGFGRSSRPTFARDPKDAESNHVEAIEEWRREVGLDKFVLLGHSMGGFISTGYALCYPQHVAHLVLADPWGFPKKPDGALKEMMATTGRPNTVKLITTIGQHVNALGLMRAAGPMGPGLIDKMRPDLVKKFEPLNNGGSSGNGEGEASVGQYIYHCNAQKPTGEEAFRTMMDFFGWAKNCMIQRIHGLDHQVPMSLIYGGSTWLQHAPEDQLKAARAPGAYTKVYTLPDAGHHVYVDQMGLFNGIVHRICEGLVGGAGKEAAAGD